MKKRTIHLQKRSLHRLLVLLIVVFLPTVESKPWVPINDSKVLETLPKQKLRESIECNRLRQQLTHSPQSVSTAARLAACYTKIARSDSDPRYYGYA